MGYGSLRCGIYSATTAWVLDYSPYLIRQSSFQALFVGQMTPPEVSDHDVDLPDDTGDEEYNAIIAEWLPFLFDRYDPRLVYFQAGVDALKEDSFGRLGMTRGGLLTRNHMVFNQCISRDVPLVITMGGRVPSQRFTGWAFAQPINS